MYSPTPLPLPKPRLRFCAKFHFGSRQRNILFSRTPAQLSVGTAAPVTMHRGYNSGRAEYYIFRRWFAVSLGE